MNTCTGCGRERRKHERKWKWIYPEVGPLIPIACFCPSCFIAREAAADGS